MTRNPDVSCDSDADDEIVFVRSYVPEADSNVKRERSPTATLRTEAVESVTDPSTASRPSASGSMLSVGVTERDSGRGTSTTEDVSGSANAPSESRRTPLRTAGLPQSTRRFLQLAEIEIKEDIQNSGLQEGDVPRFQAMVDEYCQGHEIFDAAGARSDFKPDIEARRSLMKFIAQIRLKLALAQSSKKGKARSAIIIDGKRALVGR